MIYSMFAKAFSGTSFVRKRKKMDFLGRKAEEMVAIVKQDGKMLTCALLVPGDYEKKLPEISIEFEAFVDNNQKELIQIWDKILTSLERIS